MFAALHCRQNRGGNSSSFRRILNSGPGQHRQLHSFSFPFWPAVQCRALCEAGSTPQLSFQWRDWGETGVCNEIRDNHRWAGQEEPSQARLPSPGRRARRVSPARAGGARRVSPAPPVLSSDHQCDCIIPSATASYSRAVGCQFLLVIIAPQTLNTNTDARTVSNVKIFRIGQWE